jgi:hypothetical protein
MIRLPVGVYQHYKGEYYLVEGLAHNAEDDEDLELYVLYTPLYLKPGPRKAFRSLRSFRQRISYNAQRVQRFRYIGPVMPTGLVTSAELVTTKEER